MDPFLAENSQLPFLGIPFVGEPCVPIHEEDAVVDKDVEKREPFGEETGSAAASAEPTQESDVTGAIPTSSPPPGQETKHPGPSHDAGPISVSATVSPCTHLFMGFVS